MKISVRRLLAAAAAGAGATLVAAVGLAVADLYLTGHGHASLGRPWLEWAELGVHLSRADVALLLLAATGSVLGARAARGNS